MAQTENQINEVVEAIEALTAQIEELNNTIDSSFGNGKLYYGNVVDGLFEIARSINPERFENKKK